MYRSLGQYIKVLRSEGELTEISAAADPVLEIAEMIDRESKKPGGGKALLFTDTGTGFPVLANMMGSRRRISMALGVDNLDELTLRIEETFGEFLSPRETTHDKLGMLPLLVEAAKWFPRRKKGRGKCQQVVMERPDLSKLPVLKCWPHDGGRFITLPSVHTKDPVSGIHNVGMYRMQIFSDTTTGMHWHRHKTGARHYEGYKKLGRRMPVTVCLGGDPVYTFAATAPMPDNVDEYFLAGFIRHKPVELVKCLTNDLEVPSDCDFVIEGYVDPAEEKVTEGPFGDHTGFYSLEDLYPVFHVTCITHRKDAVYPATIVGIPPMEDAYMAEATEKIFLAPIRLALDPEVRDMHMPVEGTAHNIALLSIEKSYPGQAHKVAQSMWGSGQMMFNKFMVVAPAGTDLRSSASLAALAANISIPEDVLFSKGPLDILDHAAPVTGFGGKMCIDATEKLPEERRSVAEKVVIPEKWEGFTAVNDSCAESWRAIFVSGDGDLNLPGVKGIKFVFVYDPEVPLDDTATLLWLAGANCDAERDVTVSGGRLVFDARSKKGVVPRWPNVVVSSEETIQAVDRKWPETPQSPSKKYRKLLLSDKAEI